MYDDSNTVHLVAAVCGCWVELSSCNNLDIFGGRECQPFILPYTHTMDRQYCPGIHRTYMRAQAAGLDAGPAAGTIDSDLLNQGAELIINICNC